MGLKKGTAAVDATKDGKPIEPSPSLGIQSVLDAKPRDR
jgi:hypothetical protein